VCAGSPASDTFTIDAPIGRDPSDVKKRRVRGVNAEEARTQVRVVRRAANGSATLLAITLDTGRTHQIRVHLAHAGHPLLGDPLYAPPAIAARAPRLALHATRLAWQGGEARSPAPAIFDTLIN
jgi:23S rRNA pseudouridine1911/1915/1917 synthase